MKESLEYTFPHLREKLKHEAQLDHNNRDYRNKWSLLCLDTWYKNKLRAHCKRFEAFLTLEYKDEELEKTRQQ